MKVKFRAFVPVDVVTVHSQMPYDLTEGTRGMVAYNPDTTETLAIFLAESWTANSASIHGIILQRMVLRHGWLEEIADYMFTRAARKQLYTVVRDDNKRSLRLIEKLGFRQVARLEDAVANGIDYLIFELKRENCAYWQQPALQKVS